ncbi:Riboflavin transporter [Pseudoruegeria aquimaris]|uniref:Riboflavin transporter n=1 Tax=Pseudoruegeria aquimaris TaxID=393663 RepID=A0A1Y5TDW2_9RHOB|nr:DMT family transporter [Pseudoruegeria aquimaris]SLN61392.1 Riboflavin transporter [Pseudoruegeria aquimaris]
MSPARGIGMVVLAVGMFTIMATAVKATSDHVPPGQAMFFRSAVTLPIVIAMLLARGEMHGALHTKHPLGHLMRGLTGSAAMGMGFASLAYLPLPEATAIRFSTPLFVVVLAALMLGERFRLIRLSAVAAGLLGVSIILAPRLTGDLGSQASLGALLTLGSAFCASLSQIQVKMLSGKENTATIVFYFAICSLVLSLFTAPFGWVVPTPGEAAILLFGAAVGSAGQLLLTGAYRHADASLVAPFTYSSMIWSLILGFIVFGDLPTAQMLLGAGIVIASGIVIAWREQQIARRAIRR